MVLLVVDTQKGCFDERLYAFETVRSNIIMLIATAKYMKISLQEMVKGASRKM